MADDDSWLYGEDGGGEEGVAKETEKVEEEKEKGGEDELEQEVMVTEEVSAEGDPDEAMEDGGGGEGDEEREEEEDEGDSDDSEDDGVVVKIDHERIEADNTKTIENMKIKQTMGPSSKAKKQGTFSVEDFEAIGSVKGQPAVELDMESLEEKPWRKPGADITDYFNYGFSEDTWAAYCNRQRRLRVNESGAGLTGNSAIVSQNRLTGAMTGSIPILGQGTGDPAAGAGSHGGPGARKEREEGREPSGISVMTHEKRIYPTKVLGNMDFSVPPPGFDPSLPPPIGGPGPPPGADLSGPPPSGEFPPSDPFGEYPEAGDPYQGGYEPTASAQWSAPPPGYSGEGEGGAAYGGYRGERRRDGRDDRYRDRDPRDERDRRGRRQGRSRSRDRERGDRDRRDRDRDRDRDNRDREDREKKVKKEKRSRSRSRSRSRKKSKKDKKDRKEERPEEERGDSKENKDKSDTPTKVKEEPKE